MKRTRNIIMVIGILSITLFTCSFCHACVKAEKYPDCDTSKLHKCSFYCDQPVPGIGCIFPGEEGTNLSNCVAGSDWDYCTPIGNAVCKWTYECDDGPKNWAEICHYYASSPERWDCAIYFPVFYCQWCQNTGDPTPTYKTKWTFHNY